MLRIRYKRIGNNFRSMEDFLVGGDKYHLTISGTYLVKLVSTLTDAVLIEVQAETYTQSRKVARKLLLDKGVSIEKESRKKEEANMASVLGQDGSVSSN